MRKNPKLPAMSADEIAERVLEPSLDGGKTQKAFLDFAEYWEKNECMESPVGIHKFNAGVCRFCGAKENS